MRINESAAPKAMKEKTTIHNGWNKGSTQRVNRLRDQYWKWKPEVDTERAVVYTKTYQEMEAYDVCLKRAQSLYNYMAEKTVKIYPDELIIGAYGKQPRAVIISPEICMSWVEDELETMATREQDPYLISQEDKDILREIIPYWKGRTMEDYYIANLTPEARKLAFGTNVVFGENKSQSGGGEYLAGYRDIVFKKGFRGIKAEAMEKHAALDQEDISTHEKRKFYESIMLICDAAKLQSERYAKEARNQAENTDDPKRAQELVKIARACDRVPWEPPQNLLEAFHAIWFTQLMIWSEENATAYCIERIDQLLYPYYKAEKEAGTIDDVHMQELFDCFWLKLAEMIYSISDATSKFFAGYQPYHGVAVGGCKEDGSDAVNELSYMVLQATANTQMHAPTINVRVNKNTCNEFMMAIASLVELGTGQPAIFFDETAFEILRRNGIEEGDLWNWAVGGCVEPQIPGKMSMWAEGARFNYSMAVEWTMFNGLSKILGRESGLKTGDPRTFKTYQEFEGACLAQLGHMIKAACQSAQVCERAHRLRMPIPVRSALMEGCMEEGLDAMNGGGKYNIGPGIESTGLTDMADAMAAVKKLVYDDKKITMGRLADALEADFEGYEDVRQMLMNDAPKYGNDDDYVDQIAAKVCEASCDMCESYYSIRGTKFMNGVVPVISNVPCGEATWALPTGRKAKTPLSDGISPYPGNDQNGPSAVIKSITKLDHVKNGVGTLLNMKLSPELLKTDKDKQNFIHLLRAEGALGGYHVQFNVVAKETLLDAQKHPEQHRDLLVRIAGYSAFFVELTSQAQEAIIARTEHSNW
ncbi:MAG: formate C-acetyltransferase/glycerol dehydratase family glycyl radical enzyme [Clostridiales Family XIII bacterium]|nr:formate C-acetyltransferase/glycerol dehydratase family glycyl radical enzyme [Clostridia bacterium]MDY3010053.1 formate C-acetyltransferase/glycerol dehydratase family glycyl radical enzyme [Clostridiales Family XIII bacterium]